MGRPKKALFVLKSKSIAPTVIEVWYLDRLYGKASSTEEAEDMGWEIQFNHEAKVRVTKWNLRRSFLVARFKTMVGKLYELQGVGTDVGVLDELTACIGKLAGMWPVDPKEHGKQLFEKWVSERFKDADKGPAKE